MLEFKIVGSKVTLNQVCASFILTSSHCSLSSSDITCSWWLFRRGMIESMKLHFDHSIILGTITNAPYDCSGGSRLLEMSNSWHDPRDSNDREGIKTCGFHEVKNKPTLLKMTLHCNQMCFQMRMDCDQNLSAMRMLDLWALVSCWSCLIRSDDGLFKSLPATVDKLRWNIVERPHINFKMVFWRIESERSSQTTATA